MKMTYEDSHPHSPRCSRKVVSRTRALARNDAHDFRSTACKCGRNKYGGHAMEALRKRTRVIPVTAIVLLAGWTSAANQDKSDQDEHDGRNDLQARRVELCFSEEAHGQEVDDAGDAAEERNGPGNGNLIAPVGENDAECCRFDGEDGNPTTPVLPSDGEAEGLYCVSLFPRWTCM